MNMNNDLNQNEYSAEPTGEAPNWQMAGAESFSEPEGLEPGYATAAETRNHTAMILLGICILSMVGVYMIGLRQRPQEATEEEKAVAAQVDTALAKLVDVDHKIKAQKLFKDTENMVTAFYDYPSKQQVPPDYLNKNPFCRFIPEEPGAPEDDQAKTLAQLRKELDRKASLLDLQSVFYNQTNGSKCLINGKIFAEGQRVEEVFDVKTIKTDRVVLIASDIEYVLQM